MLWEEFLWTSSSIVIEVEILPDIASTIIIESKELLHPSFSSVSTYTSYFE